MISIGMSQKTKQIMVIVMGVLIIAGLFARDKFGININKYLFLAIAIIPILFADTEEFVTFVCFLVPLYVGLPGNYISVFLLVRLLYETCARNILIKATGFILTVLVATYILLQDFFTGYTGIYNLMAALDFIVLALLMKEIREYDVGTETIVAYSVGNFILGIVMLSATLSYYSLENLMNPSTRLGYTGMLTRNSGANMAISIDPNFYAMNTMASISTICLIFHSIKSKNTKIISLISVLGSTICCLIGLSRTFIILLAVWGILWLLSQGDIKRTMMVLLATAVLVYSFFHFMPTIADGLISRFEGSDVIGGNGRIKLIIMYLIPWFKTVKSILFGIGLFNCHTHCAPLMYLFGLGILGAVPLLLWVIYQWEQCKTFCPKISLKKRIPFLITLVGFSTIPAAGAINYTFPLLISMLVLITPSYMEEP